VTLMSALDSTALMEPVWGELSVARAQKPAEIFGQQGCDFLADVSRELLLNRAYQQFPSLIAFGYWCRAANLAKMRASIIGSEDFLRVGRGLVLHIAPANVPVNFAYSFAFGVLAGNVNVVRLPSRDFSEVDHLVTVFSDIFNRPKYRSVGDSSLFLRYPSNETDVTEFLSSISDGRVIWGGDATILAVRAHLTPPRCVDVNFSDRYSFCILDTESVDLLSEDQLSRLAHAFVNDSYLFDQNACSSPRLVVWRKSNRSDGQTVRARFWSAVHRRVTQVYSLSPTDAVDKYAALCSTLINSTPVTEVSQWGNLLYVVSLDGVPPDAVDLPGKSGTFYECVVQNLRELADIVNPKFQTLTYFGLSTVELRLFIVASGVRGIDRIVPVGKALEMSLNWDGYDVIRSLSRIVDIQ
jgi:hypothetical protein